MSILGNILWFICGGLLSGLSWVFGRSDMLYNNYRNSFRKAVFQNC